MHPWMMGQKLKKAWESWLCLQGPVWPEGSAGRARCVGLNVCGIWVAILSEMYIML